MKKLLTFTLAISITAAGFAAGKDCVIKFKNNTGKRVNAIKADDKGNLMYKDGKFVSRVRAGDYIFAWIPKPSAITSADQLIQQGKLDKALSEFKSLYDKYRYLGWDIYCLNREAEVLKKKKKYKEAIAILEPLQNYDLKNTVKKRDDLMLSYKLLSSLYLDSGQDKKAMELLAKLSQAKNDDVAIYSFIGRGEIYEKEKKLKYATDMYLQAALLFPKSELRPMALCKVANLLKAQNDKRWTIWAQKLKSEYPKSKYVSELK